MIVKKIWIQPSKTNRNLEWYQEGWFLFGVIPLYIRDMSARSRKG